MPGLGIAHHVRVRSCLGRDTRIGSGAYVATAAALQKTVPLTADQAVFQARRTRSPTSTSVALAGKPGRPRCVMSWTSAEGDLQRGRDARYRCSMCRRDPVGPPAMPNDLLSPRGRLERDPDRSLADRRVSRLVGFLEPVEPRRDRVYGRRGIAEHEATQVHPGQCTSH